MHNHTMPSSEKKHIVISDKVRCSGCTACYSACPRKCISMKEDSEGFLYPEVDEKLCINCGKCLNVCPYEKAGFTFKDDKEELGRCYAAYYNDEAIRYRSSSGGMFRAFADKIIEKGGVVFGAVFDKDFTVKHSYTETLEGLVPMMGSKYLQSRMQGVFPLVKQFLDEKRLVLFTGCGCQVAGLKAFLGKDYPNLLTVDLICHGVDSPKIWKEYLKALFPDEEVVSVSFRDKSTGQNNSSIIIKGAESEFKFKKREAPYFKAWNYALFMRPSCSICPFKRDNRASDITISDCWGSQKIAPELYDDKGLSSIVVHTNRGKELFDSITPKLVYKESCLDDLKQFNTDYIRTVCRFDWGKRKKFWVDYYKGQISFIQLLEKYLKETNSRKMLLILKRTIRKYFSLFEKIVKLLSSVKDIHFAEANKMLEADRRFNETFRFSGNKMPRRFKREPEWQAIVVYRRYQANVGNIVGRWYLHRLTRLEKKTGIHFEGNPNIGKGLIIGHYGRIIINSKATFGDQIYITHGVTIGRNATGKKAGVPHIGNKVRIGANACIVGNIKIGDDVMIAPNTFVNVDVPDHSVVIGNPCIIHHKDNATNGYLGFL